jgi:hypothetical protein
MRVSLIVMLMIILGELRAPSSPRLELSLVPAEGLFDSYVDDCV